MLALGPAWAMWLSAIAPFSLIHFQREPVARDPPIQIPMFGEKARDARALLMVPADVGYRPRSRAVSTKLYDGSDTPKR